jgi:hypothetical protein
MTEHKLLNIKLLLLILLDIEANIFSIQNIFKLSHITTSFRNIKNKT